MSEKEKESTRVMVEVGNCMRGVGGGGQVHSKNKEKDKKKGRKAERAEKGTKRQR